MGISFFVRDLIIYGILLVLVLFITKQHNIWGVKKATSKTKVDVKKAKEEANYRNIILWFLNKADMICHNFGFEPSLAIIEKYRYNIFRGRLNVPYVDRAITPTELIGIFKVIKFISCFLAIFLTVLTYNLVFLMFFFGVFVNKLFEYAMEFKIIEEDTEIEEDFPDLYMLLYSRLIRGTSMRLAPTLDEYLNSIDAIYGEKSHQAMRNFVMDLRKNIEIYGDDSMAIHKMRDVYRSAMLVNFFNLAVQSLRGVDNKDKLLAFKMELSQKKLDLMTKKAEAMVAKGQKAVMLIFIILGQFIVLSWVAKAGLSFVHLV